MSSGGHTTVIKRVLERRVHEPQAPEDTTATVAVMLRVLPPPRALLVVRSSETRKHLEERIHSEMLNVTQCAEHQTLEHLIEQFHSVVMTDSLPLVKRIRAQKLSRAPFIVYITASDGLDAIESALLAGADDCLARNSSEPTIKARLGTARRIAELEEALRITLSENRELSTVDELTRVANRRFFGKQFPRELERAARQGQPVSLILCDIDFFKHVNDTVGHVGGDEVLRQFCARLQGSLRRDIDWVARLGGEEFAVVLPETQYDPALATARRLRTCIADRPFQIPGHTVEVTASFGLCNLERAPHGERKTADQMLRVADAALYRSKRSGRNRVTATLMPKAPRRGGTEIDRLLGT